MTNWYDDAPTIQIHKVESRVSRIPRRCHRCNKTINRGDRYVHVWSVEDGESAWDNCHVRCSYEYGYGHEHEFYPKDADRQDYMAGTGAYAESVEEDPND